MFTTNVGTTDRIVRIIAGLILAIVAYAALTPPWIYVGYVVAAVLVLTGLARICPAYTLFGINTCGTRHA
ncbi:YgaP family membrane protein [Consotaella salsifontis]|uniref:Inner membrane protein YgaP-like transmembrane domain-containing protein n=1 Tax=Consotaella salsifontis TaxID=1365950 RepID=A0A1T4PW15_9HYPH|nr:DUF2892 domain-containing protein [Consotaella salsifontis]SJZ95659.1 Protein of unknown function [Consotaella salsifontis]